MFNINGMTIHLAFAIPLNKKFNELKAVSDEKHDNLIQNCDQLHLIIVDETCLVSNRMLSFIDRRLRIIKQVHNQFMDSNPSLIITRIQFPIQLVALMGIFSLAFSKLEAFHWKQFQMFPTSADFKAQHLPFNDAVKRKCKIFVYNSNISNNVNDQLHNLHYQLQEYMQCMQKCKFFLQIHKQIIPQFIFPSHLPN